MSRIAETTPSLNFETFDLETIAGDATEPVLDDLTADNDAQAAQASAQASELARIHADAAAAAAARGYGGWDPMMSGSGFVSNSELMEWLAVHGESQSDELRGMMNACDARNKLVEDLADVKNSINHKSSQATVRANIDQLLTDYAGSPYEAELTEMLQPMLDAIDEKTDDDGNVLMDTTIENWNATIQSKLDAYGKADQLDMLQIQDLTSKIREGVQLISNMMSGINQTAMAIVGNVGR